MSRFVTLRSKEDDEFIINLDLIEAIIRTGTACHVYIGGADSYLNISLDEFETLKKLLVHEFKRY